MYLQNGKQLYKIIIKNTNAMMFMVNRPNRINKKRFVKKKNNNINYNLSIQHY